MQYKYLKLIYRKEFAQMLTDRNRDRISTLFFFSQMSHSWKQLPPYPKGELSRGCKQILKKKGENAAFFCECAELQRMKKSRLQG